MTINYRALYSQMLQVEQNRAYRRRLQIYRLLTYGLPCALIPLAVIGWLWRVHYCNPCNSFPELCRPSGGEVRP